MTKTSEALVDMIVSSAEDDLIPFSDTPHISRFGPISRRTGTLLQTVTASQTQAVISDEPTATAVVRHSKQIARQVPTLAALYHSNGKYAMIPMAIKRHSSSLKVPEPPFSPLLLESTAKLDTLRYRNQHPNRTSLYSTYNKPLHLIKCRVGKIPLLPLLPNPSE